MQPDRKIAFGLLSLNSQKYKEDRSIASKERSAQQSSNQLSSIYI